MTRIAVFASGRGSNFQSIYHQIKAGYIPARVVVLISNKEQAGALTFAREQGIPAEVVQPEAFPNPEEFGKKLLEILQHHRVDWIVLAGYLKKIPDNVVEAYANRIVNIHPALLPAFGGKGMYGMRVHQAVFASGAKVSGVTVHLVNTEYDAGPIVLQKCVDISDCPSPEAIAEKVLAIEHQLYPQALKLLLENPFSIANNRVMIGTLNND